MKNYLILLLLFPVILFSQENDQYKLDYNNSEKVTKLCTQLKSNGFKSNIDADNSLAKILSVVGASKRFIIAPCENINNALAIIDDGIRYILYDPKFLNSISNNTKYWGNMSILAHEVGHHINGHTLGTSVSAYENKLQELEADEFSGFVMQKLGATLEQATETIVAIAKSGDDSYSSHPNKERRILAMTKGYNNALNNKFVKEEKLSDWEEYYYRGLEKNKAKDFDGAINDFSESIKLNPSAKSYIERGYSKVELDDITGAISDFQRAIEIDPKNSEAYYGLGYYKYFNQDYYGSLSAFESRNENIDLTGNSTDLYVQFLMSKSLFAKDIFDQSFSKIDGLIKNKDLTSVIDDNSILAGIYELRGLNYTQKDSLSLSMLDFEKAAELAPEVALYQERIGDTYSETKEYDKAIEYYNKAILLDKNKTTVYEWRAYAYEKKEDFFSALFDMNEAIKLNPEKGFYYFKRGEYKLKTNDKKGACEDWLIGNKKGSEESLNKLIELCGYKKEDFYTADDYYNLGYEENEKENYAAALISFSKATKLGYSKPDLLTANTAFSYYRLKEYQKGLKILNTIPKNTDQVNLDWITQMSIDFKYELKDYSGAIREAKEFISLNKLNPDEVNAELNTKYINDNLDRVFYIYYFYSQSFHSISDYDNSIIILNQFLKIGKTISDNSFIGKAYYNLATAKKAKGDNLGAMQDINETLKIDNFKTSYTSLLLRAELKLAIGSKKTACEDLKEALKYAIEKKSDEYIAEITKLIKENCE
jgi:tetratricopeptide (TPR) repeat protein